MAGGAPRKSNRRVKAPTQTGSVSYDPFRDFEGGPVELFLHKTFYYVRTNIRIVLGVVGLAVAGLIGAISYNIYSENRETAAREAFEELVGDPRLGEDVESTAPGARLLQTYREEHPIESARRRSFVYEMDLYRTAGEYEKAADVAGQLVDELEMPELRAYYAYRAAVNYEKSQKFEKAAEFYTRMLEFVGEEPYMKALALFGQGRSYNQLGKTEEARQAFGELWAIEQQDDIQGIRAAAAAYLLAP